MYLTVLLILLIILKASQTSYEYIPVQKGVKNFVQMRVSHICKNEV